MSKPIYTIAIDSELLIAETNSPELTPADFTTIIQAIVSALEKSSCKKVLVNHLNSDVSLLSATEIKFIAEQCEAFNETLVNGKLAVVLNHGVEFGLGRMWLAYSEGRHTFDSSIFVDLQDARTWLLSL